MLNQQINLYQERFRGKIIILSALHMLIVSGLCLLIMAVVSYWYNNQYAQSKYENELGLEQKKQLSQTLEASRKKLETLLASNQVDKKINQVNRDIAVRKQMIEFVTHNQFGSGKGFSHNLGELSEFKIDDVWLNEITLGEDFMKISGSALQAENVPEYFNLLRSRKVFSGQVFDVFEVDRSKSRDWKVDFVIASSLDQHE